jgi:hypothetical protein
VGNPPSLSVKLTRQWRWIWLGLVLMVLTVYLSNVDLNLGGFLGSSDSTCRIEVTADVLNVRAGPGTEYPTVQQLSRYTVVAATAEVSNGFRKLGDGRWVASEFVTTLGNCA